MLFGESKRLKSSRKKLEITFSDKHINFVAYYKYLSIINDNTMTLNDNLSRTNKAAGARLQLLGKMKSFNHCQSKICYLYIYDYTLADIQLPYPINLYQEAAGQFFFDVQKQCYPMSHSQQVSTTIWSVNLLTWWRSVWTKSLHLIYLIIILRWLIIQWTLGIISTV